MSDEAQGPGWWQASDGRWYPPQEPPAPGWWLASDGEWYPPSDGEGSPAGEPASEPAGERETPPVGETASETAAAPPPGAGGPPPSSSRRGPLVVLGIAVVLVLLVVVGVVLAGGGDDEIVASGDGVPSTTADDGEDDGGEADGESVISDEMPSEDITLADDVVIVDSERGERFLGYSDDGTAMLLDAGAEGLDELDEGEVLLLSGITVVRVAQLDELDEGIVVTGEPVTLPEVVADGELEWDDVVLPPEDVRLFLYDDGSGGGSGAEGTGPTEDEIVDEGGEGIVEGLEGASTEPASGPVVATPASFALPSKTVSGKVGEFSFDMTHEPEGSGHHLVLDLSSSGDLVGSISVDVHLGSLVSSGGAVVSGRQVRSFDFDLAELGGEATITTDLQSTQQLTSVMTPPFLKVPFGLEFPALVGGIPFTFSVNGTIQVQLSMALANATLGGRAEITFGGDAGFHFADGSLTVSGKRVQDAPDLLNTLTGGGGGPVGVVVTAELPKVGFGFGFLQTGAGVYLSSGMVVAQTILPPPPACTSTQIAYVLAGGVEAKFLGKEFDLGRKPVVDKRWDYTVPQTQQCQPELRGG